MTGEIYVGVDSCPKGWFFTVITDGAGCETGIAPDIKWLWNKFNSAAQILIDIPIGLAYNSRRLCDTAARKFLGPGRAASVFPPPCRETIYARDYETACNINQKNSGQKISRQAWGISPKIREVDDFLKGHPKARKKIRESHPEVCFRALAEMPISYSKKKTEGFTERFTILSKYLPETPKIVNNALRQFERKDVARDDILDSMVLALTSRFGNDGLNTLPEVPEKDSIGLPMEIVYPNVDFQHSPQNGCKENNVNQAIFTLIKKCDSASRLFPATEFYNETWMLRLILEWFSKNNIKNHPFSFSKNCRWFSEGLIPSQFLARYRGDPLAESWTHADGIIGHFEVGEGGKADVCLRNNAQHLVCVEAKMFSRLSSGVKNASYFNQAARYAACMAELLKNGTYKPSTMKGLGLYVIAPKSQIDADAFGKKMTREHIKITVKRRVDEYKGEKNTWFQERFLPTLEKIELQILSWESILEDITKADEKSGVTIQKFYTKSLSYNRPNTFKHF